MKRLGLWIGVAGLISVTLGAASGLPDEGQMPDLDGATAWINSAPLSSRALRGKVVVINFWTYSCINSLRELPYIRAWAEKYKGAGLVVIGVHSPEFGFEKDAANVRHAVRELKIEFPIPIDSDHAIWSAFRNEYWPADYFIDRHGRVRYRHFGEGDYEKSEQVIQELLRENGAADIGSETVSIAAAGTEAPPSADVASPESYIGYKRAERFVSRERLALDSRRAYNLPIALSLNQWAFGGVWRVGAEHSGLQAAPGKVVFRFRARDLHMVLGVTKKGVPVRFRVTLDGEAPGFDHGADSAPDGTGSVREPRLYQLIRQTGQVQDRTFEIEFVDPGVEVFSFTFG